MTKIEELERAVEKLPPDQLARFRDWFDSFDAARLDAKIEADIRAGKLESLAARARLEFLAGRVQEL